MRISKVAAAFLVSAGPAAAQDGWSGDARIYGWFPGITTASETSQGPIETEVSTGDLISNLDATFMGAVELRHGPWGFIGDLVYSDVSKDVDLAPGGNFAEAGVSSKMTLFSAYAMYRVSDAPQLSFDVGAGFRVIDAKLGAALTGGVAPAFSYEADGTWVDPLVAARLIAPFGGNWSGALFGDYGGSGSDSTWQVLATVGYRFSDKWSMQAGYRHIEFSRDFGNMPTTVKMNGPVIGVAMKF